MALLRIKNLTKRFGGISALQAIDVAVEAGTILSLIGPNGAGKTTLFNCVTGQHLPTGGEVLFRGERISGLRPHRIARKGLARTFQAVRLFAGMTVLENVMVGGHNRAASGVWRALVRPQAFVEQEEALASRALELLQFVDLAHAAHLWAGQLSYGEQRRLEIARALAAQPALLLLDEPAAGMNPRETLHLIGLIRQVKETETTIFLIEHDMRVVMGISDRIVVLDHGVKLAEGSPEEIRRDPRVIEAYLGQSH